MSHIDTMGKLYVVATPIGNLNDLSQRAQDVLREVTWVAAEDTRHSQGLLQRLGVSPVLISYHEHNERERSVQLVDKLTHGESGALISDAGTPLISDPGYLLVARAHAAGVQVVPIPGPCAAIAALSVSGLPTDKFLFEGFLPAKPQARQKRVKELNDFTHTMVLFEAPHRFESMLKDLVEIWGAHRKATCAREITKKFESIRLSTLGEILVDVQNNVIPSKGEFILVVEGKEDKRNLAEATQEMERVLSILLAEMSLKQAVQVAIKLTGLPKNTLYDCAMQLQSSKRSQAEY